MSRKRKASTSVTTNNAGRVNKKQKVDDTSEKLLIEWIQAETLLLKRLLYRNRNQHRYTPYVKSLDTTIRRLGVLNSHFSVPPLDELWRSEKFNRDFFMALTSVLNSTNRLTRLHVHRHFVPLVSVLIAILSRIWYLLKKVPEILRFNRPKNEGQDATASH